MKLTNVKSMVAKGVTVGLLAGAVALAAPAKARRSRLSWASALWYPLRDYYGPAGYYERLRHAKRRRAA